MSPTPSRRRRGVMLIVPAAAAVAAAVAVTATAAPGRTPTVRVAQAVQVGAHQEPIAVNSRGRPVYELTPETVRHLLCTKAGGCFQFWHPVTVARHGRLVKGAGLSGRLMTLSRDGLRQVALNGHPLYTFAGDTSGSAARGEAIRSFGGTWHVVREGSAAATPPATTTSTTSSTPASTTSTTPASSTTTAPSSTTTTSTSSSPYPGY